MTAKRAVAWSPPLGAADLPVLAELLTTGGDERIAASGPGGANRYGRRPFPEPDLTGFGSSTASTISGAAFAAAERRRAELARGLAGRSAQAVYAEAADSVRRELVDLLGLSDMAGLAVALAPSGTDLHRLAARFVAGDRARPLRVILAAAGETGSRVPAALGLGGRCEVAEVAVRTPDGRIRDPEAVDREVEARLDEAHREGRRALLVLVDVSKTGLVSPGPALAARLAGRPDEVAVLVDACQLRLARASLRAYLDRGFLVAVTGSKFVGGPAFSGALLVPPAAAVRLGGDLGEEVNLGLLMRWTAALAELRAFAALPEAEVARFVRRFGEMVGSALAETPGLSPAPMPAIRRPGRPAGWDALPTIFPFHLRPSGRPFGLVEAEQVDRLMRNRLAEAFAAGPAEQALAGARFELGQPVACGTLDAPDAAVLRLCLGARTLVRALTGPDGEAEVLDLGRAALAKAAFVADALARRGIGA